MSASPPVAAIDCGSNSTRLLVAAAGSDSLHALARDQIVTRLGKGVDETGRLDETAIARTVDVIAGYAEVWRRHGAVRVRIAATSAVRDSGNRERFCEAVTERVGETPEILTGEQEAALAFAGAVKAVDPLRPALVLDIGGGSTELIVGRETPSAWTSRQLGCVRLTERALPGDPPTRDAVRAAEAAIDVELEAAQAIIAPHGPASLVAVAGTATTLAALHLGLAEYDRDRVHGHVLPADALDALVERMRGLRAAEIAELGPIQPGREDVLLAGAVIFSRTLRRFGLGEAVISEGDLLDGLCAEAIERVDGGSPD